jgi:hypothetical protein
VLIFGVKGIGGDNSDLPISYRKLLGPEQSKTARTS